MIHYTTPHHTTSYAMHSISHLQFTLHNSNFRNHTKLLLTYHTPRILTQFTPSYHYIINTLLLINYYLYHYHTLHPYTCYYSYTTLPILTLNFYSHTHNSQYHTTIHTHTIYPQQHKVSLLPYTTLHSLPHHITLLPHSHSTTLLIITLIFLPHFIPHTLLTH
jgi:hypothetical protein